MSEIPMFLNGVTWEAVPPSEQHMQRMADGNKLPHVTHSGVFELMGHKMRCFRLSTGQAVFEKDDFEKFCAEFLGVQVSEDGSANSARPDTGEKI